MKKCLQILCLISLALWTAACSTAAVNGRADVSYVRQVMTSDNTTSRTIMWQTKGKEAEPKVEYRVKGSLNAKSAPAMVEKFKDDNVVTYIYTASLAALQPGTEYEYRVGYGTLFNEWQSLKTAKGNNFKALIYPDSQSNDYSGWKKLAQDAYKANPDAQFFVNMGDLVDNGEDHKQWNAWFDAVQGIIDTIPVAPVMGNHETYNQKWKVRMPVAYLHLFNLPGAGIEQEYKNQYYSFDYGDVHFIVLNTQLTEMTEFQPGLAAAQKAWFEADVAKSQKKWKVVLMHKDPLQYAFATRPQPREEGFSEEGKTWMPLFDQYGIDAVISAHLHTYRNRGHIKNFVRDASGPLYVLTGVAGNVYYPGLWRQHKLDEVIAPQPETDDYLTMEATEDSIKFEAFLPNGKKIDSVQIAK